MAHLAEPEPVARRRCHGQLAECVAEGGEGLHVEVVLRKGERKQVGLVALWSGPVHFSVHFLVCISGSQAELLLSRARFIQHFPCIRSSK